MSEPPTAQPRQAVIKGRVSEHGLPIWLMPEHIAIEFPEGRCRIVHGRHGNFLYFPADHFLGRAIETCVSTTISSACQ
jgi:hypothetical protein